MAPGLRAAFEFTQGVKNQTRLRQAGVCAICGNSLDWVGEEYHHVVPVKALEFAPKVFDYSWFKTQLNCVALCTECHSDFAHDGGKFNAEGREPPPSHYEYSHGSNRSEHNKWVGDLNQKAELVYYRGGPPSGGSGGTSPPNTGPADGTFVPPPALPVLPSAGGAGLATVGFAILGFVAVAKTLSSFVRQCRNVQAAYSKIAALEKDIDEKRRLDPALGCLVAIVYRIDVEQSFGINQQTISFDNVIGYYAYTQEKAIASVKASPPYATRDTQRQETTLLTFSIEAIWIKPNKPKVFGTSIDGTIAAIEHAMSHPPDENQAFQILNGCSLYDVIRIYKHFMTLGKYAFLWNNIARAQGVNQPRLSLAVAAISYRDQGISFEKFSTAMGSWMPSSGTGDHKELSDYLGAAKQVGGQHPIVGTWSVKIGGWGGRFVFTKEGSASWSETGGKRHLGKWWRYQGAVNWQFDDDPPGFQRTFEAVEPIGLAVAGKILPEGQGFFNMSKG